jgi:hypothetical protein
VNYPLVSRQQYLHRQRQWSNASGWLELDSALSKRTQISALAPLGFNASRFNDLASRSIFPRNEPPNPAKYLGERPEMIFSQREVTEGQNKKRN